MRILIVNSEHPPIGGGAGNASSSMAKRLSDLGDEVTILTCSYKDFPKLDHDNGVRILRVISIRQELSQSSPLEQLSFMVGSIIEGILIIRRWKPDVIISYFGIPSGPLGWVGKKIFGIPYIISLRGGDVPGFRSYDFGLIHKLSSPIIKRIWKGANAVVANSNGLKNLAFQFAPEVPCLIINNGVDTNFFQLKNDFVSNQRIIFVGRLVYQKGLDIIFNALAKLKQYPWQFTIVGDGPAREELQSLAKSLGIEDRIHFLGWKTREVIKEFFIEANIFVFPSRDEGMSNAVLEAMAAGLVVVASNIPGNQDIIQDQISGYLVPGDSIDLWVDQLKKLLNDSDLYEKIGLAANNHVRKNFSWDNTAKEYRELILRMISN